MPKKKKFQKKLASRDVTLNDSADAPKPISRIKKSSSPETSAELTWDQLDDDKLDVVEQLNEDGTKNIVYKQKGRCKSEKDNIEDHSGVVYPEIVWYLISRFVKPEDVGRFAGINKAAYSMTKRESFWRGLYQKYCEGHPKLPKRLRLETSYKLYGLRQRVIRALYCTYAVFIDKVMAQASQDCTPHQLVKRRCVNVWYDKGAYWNICFKFKKLNPSQTSESRGVDFIEELGRIDANPEEDCQVMLVICQRFYEVPPLMGLTLSSVSVVMSQGFSCHRLHLGFNSSSHASKDVQPDQDVVLDTVMHMMIFDWWHPNYPHFDNRLPSHARDDESVPVLKKDFFFT